MTSASKIPSGGTGSGGGGMEVLADGATSLPADVVLGTLEVVEILRTGRGLGGIMNASVRSRKGRLRDG